MTSDFYRAFLLGGGEMGKLIVSYDWATSSLGPLEAWPPHLKTAVNLCLMSGFPTFILYGPDMLGVYNDAFLPILGSKHPGFLGKPCAEYWPEIWESVRPRLRQVMEERRAVWMEDSLLPIDRRGFLEETYFTYSYTPLCALDGAVEGVFVTVQDTSSHVLGERRLRSLRALASNTSNALSLQEAFRMTEATLAHNEFDFPFAALYLLSQGRRELELRGATRTNAPFFPPSVAATDGRLIECPDSLEEWTECLGAVVRSGEPLVVTLGPHLSLSPTLAKRAVVLPLGASLQGLLIVGLNPMHMPDDSLLDFYRSAGLQVASTLSAAWAYEREKERAESLAALDRAKTEFFENASHEFRTPLTLMLGPLEELMMASTPHRPQLAMAYRNGLRLLKLVNDLLDFARIEAGRIQMVRRPANLASLTADLASLFRSSTEKAGIQLVVECPPLSQPVCVDADMWEKIVLNLIANAFNHTSTGEIQVRVAETADGALLTVRDTGCGIDAEDLPHVFDRFYRAHSRRVRSREGSGIGLALVAELVRLHGGTIRVDSMLSVGTTFFVSIPFGTPPPGVQSTSPRVDSSARTRNPEWWISDPEAAFPTPATPVGQHALAEPHQPPILLLAPQPTAEARDLVLIVEDHPDMQLYLSRILSERYHVAQALDGQQALLYLRSAVPLPALVVTDIMMPAMTGTELLLAIRAEESLRHLPVIFLSARAGEEARTEGVASGADDYLVKPFSAKELLVRVGARIELSRMRQAAEKREQALRQEAERANRAKDHFLAVLSHELRTPLTPVLLLAEELQTDRSLPARVREDMGMIVRNVGLEVQLISDLLDITKIREQKLALHPERVDAHELLHQTVSMLRCGAEEKQLTVHTTLAASACDVLADPARLQQIYWNLLSNAIKFTPSGGRISIRSCNTEGLRLRLEFSDTGIGIDAPMLAKLFRPFEQGDELVTRRYGGLGLGLSISHTLAQLLGGSLEAVSAGPGRGSTFILILPTVDSVQRNDTVEGVEGTAPATPATSRGDLCVLLVEDNVATAYAMKRMLHRRLGHRVLTAATFADAVTALQSPQPIDIVLCDLGLPDRSGLDLTPHIRAAQPGARAVALTGYGTDDDKRRTREAGFAVHLTKPVRFADLQRTFAELAPAGPRQEARIS